LTFAPNIFLWLIWGALCIRKGKKNPNNGCIAMRNMIVSVLGFPPEEFLVSPVLFWGWRRKYVRKLMY